MELDPVFLSRLQFAFVISFHIVFPAFTIGLAAWLATIEGARLATGNVAPSVTRVAVIRDATNPSGIAQFGVIQGEANNRWYFGGAPRRTRRARLTPIQVLIPWRL